MNQKYENYLLIYFRDCSNRTEEHFSNEERFSSPARFLGYEKLEQKFEDEFLKRLKQINRLPTSYLVKDLLAEFRREKSSTPDFYDDFYSKTIDEIEVLGEIQECDKY